MPGRARPESTSAAASSWASTSQRTRPGSSTTGSAPTTPSTASSSDGVWIESSSATTSRSDCSSRCWSSTPTVPRLGVRPVLWPRGFPSVTGLGSSNSAAARYRLVRCLHRYNAGVRLLRAFHHRLTASRLPDAVPPVTRRDDPKTSQVPAGGVRACMGSQTPRCPAAPRHSGAPDIAFDHEKSLGTFGTYQFRRSIPCPLAPLPTLHRHPHGYRCTARGESWIGQLAWRTIALRHLARGTGA